MMNFDTSDVSVTVHVSDAPCALVRNGRDALARLRADLDAMEAELCANGGLDDDTVGWYDFESL